MAVTHTFYLNELFARAAGAERRVVKPDASEDVISRRVAAVLLYLSVERA